MTSGPTYYDLFGVTPAATPAQLRAAYLSLMKQHHPDLASGGERQLASDFAAFLNRSYAILKDPDGRARYNAHLADQAFRSWRATPKRRALLTGAVYRRPGRRWDMSSVGAGLLIIATVAVAIAGTLAPPGSPGIGWAATPPLAQARASTLRAPLELEDRQARGEARRAILSSRDEAVLESRDCFRSARERLSRRDTELCVIFDEAYLDWQDASSMPRGREDYFNQLVVGIRHRDAMAALGAVDPMRLDELRDIALNALLAEIREAEGQLPPDAAYSPSATLMPADALSR